MIKLGPGRRWIAAALLGISMSVASMAQADALTDALEAQTDEHKARHKYRNPKATLKFFGIEPGMTVVEAMPGGGWYTRVLVPYLGSEGHIIGTNYPMAVLRTFDDATEEQLEQAAGWAGRWPGNVSEWGDAKATAFRYGEVPDDAAGTADAVLFFRALHGMVPVNDGAVLRQTLSESFDLLKPGGTLGIVQHAAREDMPDDWANGENGYIKESFVISTMEDIGFEFVARSDINVNDKDRPGTEDFVWRLPPSLDTSEEDPELREKMLAIGESNRMTLKFRKPE